MTQQSWFQNKHIVLGVTGGIACYKACEIARELGRRGAIVQVVMTEAATAFVSALTFQALTGREVRVSLLDPSAEAGMGHIELARWADLILIAPCTANTLAQLASGQAPDLMTTLWTAADCEKAIAPAMNQHMWGQTQTQNNTQQLSDTSVHIVGPDSGIQACGDVGSGRMTEPMAILDELESKLSKGPLARQHLVITAGPTHEPIDPVRYIANRSSGKMGFALAESANRLGARVTLISGPVHLDTPNGVKRIDINTASEMFEAVEHAISDATLFIGAAAVCDMRPVTIASQKLKKSNSDLSRIDLIENPDIIKAVATHSNRPALVVGFAAETDDMMEHAQQKLVSKSLDLIIANSVANGKIFGQDSTEATLIDANTTRQLLSGPKDDVATQILIEISKLLPERI